MNNFAVRTISSVVFVLVMVFGLIWDRTAFGALFLIIMVAALTEFYGITLGQRYKVQQKLGVITGALAFLIVAAWKFFGLDIHYLALDVIPLLGIAVFSIFNGELDDFNDISYIYAGLLYIALPITLSPMLVMDGDVFDGWLMLSLFILIWLSDAGAYCIGTAFGQKETSKKLAPKISPKKSWWGFWGGMACCILAAVGLHFLTWLPFSLVHCMAIGAIVSAAGVAGDLFESMWKRHFHVKDSGNCIPGHGGMLDRFDSSLVAIPLAAAYMIAFSLI